jgi:hypothetical protein
MKEKHGPEPSFLILMSQNLPLATGKMGVAKVANRVRYSTVLHDCIAICLREYSTSSATN